MDKKHINKYWPKSVLDEAIRQIAKDMGVSFEEAKRQLEKEGLL